MPTKTKAIPTLPEPVVHDSLEALAEYESQFGAQSFYGKLVADFIASGKPSMSWNFAAQGEAGWKQADEFAAELSQFCSNKHPGKFSLSYKPKRNTEPVVTIKHAAPAPAPVAEVAD